jgi:DNA-binding transcriptional LysR family regulator
MSNQKPSLTLIHEDERRFVRTVDWNLFSLFLEIVSSGGISAAARQLNRQQPTVSAGLKRLEDHLGVELCHRTSQGIELTPAGRALLPLCETMMNAVRSVPHEVARAAELVEGVINIKTMSSIVSPELDAALSAFHRIHPGVEIHLDVVPWRGIVKALKLGEAEVGIACDSAPSEELRYEPLMKEVQQLYCSRGHPLYGVTIHQPSDLCDEPFIRTGEDEPEELERFRRRYGLGRRVGGFAENLHEVKRLIELGIGIGFLPTCVADEIDRAHSLWPLIPADLLPSYHVYLITREQDQRDTPTELFLEEILRRLRARPAEGAPES